LIISSAPRREATPARARKALSRITQSLRLFQPVLTGGDEDPRVIARKDHASMNSRSKRTLGGPVAIASYLGLSAAELRMQLRTGRTLAQIAIARGRTLAGLEDAIHTDVEAHLDQALVGVRLSAA
jgi:hypothetical protein